MATDVFSGPVLSEICAGVNVETVYESEQVGAVLFSFVCETRSHYAALAGLTFLM